MRRVLVSFMFASGLLGCTNYEVENADVVYIIPTNCTGSDSVCARGDYPADTSFEVIYEVGVGSEEFQSGECSIEQTGELELTVHITWRSNPSSGTGIAKSFHECDDMTPPLAAGIWTIHHGSATETLEIPRTQVDTTCLLNYNFPDLSCAEVKWGE